MRLFAAGLIAARSRSSSSVTVNNRQEEACDEQRNVFLRKTRLQNNGREEGNAIFFWMARLEGRWQLTDASPLVACGAVWRRRIEFDGDAHQRPVVCLCCTEKSWAKSRGCLASKRQYKRENCLRFCAFPGLFSKFYSSTWELNHHRGWFIGPIGSHGTAWSAQCPRKVRQFSCFIYCSQALPWDDMTQS